MTGPARACPMRRAGTTLVEIVLVVVLGGLIATVATRTFRAQQRAIGGAVELAEMRAQLRQGLHILASELRTIAPAEGDIHEWTYTGIVVRSIVGNSVVCRRESDSTLVLPPLDAGPTSWMTLPQPGDSLRVLDEGIELDGSDDVWQSYEIATLAPVAEGESCTLGSGTVPGVTPSMRVRLAGGVRLGSGISAGAPIRIFHPARYELYRSGDGLWYLGASECRSGRLPACSTIQPISGPYRAGRPGGEGSGLELAYFDRAGMELHPGFDDPRRIARIDMTVRADAKAPSVWSRTSARALSDSMQLAIAPRNEAAPE